jgi:hypothetical protein
MNITTLYEQHCAIPSDINEHLPTLKSYYDKCYTVTEFGVRGGVSLTAALASNAQKVFAYDINPVTVPKSDKLIFTCASSLVVDIEPTDFLFIDSLHTYDQLFQELCMHSNNVNKWIGMHDTIMFGEIGEDQNKGLNYAIQDFLTTHTEWSVELIKTNNNGLTILKK